MVPQLSDDTTTENVRRRANRTVRCDISSNCWGQSGQGSRRPGRPVRDCAAARGERPDRARTRDPYRDHRGLLAHRKGGTRWLCHRPPCTAADCHCHRGPV